MPDELSQLILLQLRPKDIIGTCSINEQYRKICSTETFWQFVGEINWRKLGIYLANNSKLIPIYDKNVIVGLYKNTLFECSKQSKPGHLFYLSRSII